MLETCEEEVKKVERELEQLEAEINPALDDNALVAFSYLLSKVIDEMKSVPEVYYSFEKVTSELADKVVVPTVLAVSSSCLCKENSRLSQDHQKTNGPADNAEGKHSYGLVWF